MRVRLTLLVALLSLTAACGGAGSEISTAVADAPAKRVALWGAEDGFVTATMNALRPPRVVVYSDGVVIADASKQLKLTEDEVSKIVASMRTYLTGQPPTAQPRPDAPTVSDVPTTVLGVRGQDGTMLEVRVPALDQVASFYPKQLPDAKELMDGLAVRAAASGTDYAGTRVRLVVEGAASAEGKPAPWPAGVEEPSGSVDPVWQKDLDGVAVAAITKAVPAGQEYGTSLFKTSSGALFALSWRYLLPDE
ncbi:hypothetical protein ACIBP6_02900 [Nonomuraea terrae]|uniref:hypothetical protein n=1 Tax=Nonomuraea terrae TaxID=2530383 RepID=UPI0037AC6B47